MKKFTDSKLDYEITLEEFVCAVWLPHVKSTKISWKIDEATARNHILPSFGKRLLSAIKVDDIRQWIIGYQKKRCAPSTCARRFYVLKSIFNLAVENELLEINPTAEIRFKRIKKVRWPSLDVKYLSSLLDTLRKSPKREAKAIALLLLTGARKSEIIRARWENLFLEDGILLVSRVGTPSHRKIWLSSDAMEILKSIRRQPNSPWIFPGRDVTKPISDIFLFWKGVRTELGLDALSIRDLRYVFADWQLRSGVSLPVLHRIMGINDMRELKESQRCEGLQRG